MDRMMAKWGGGEVLRRAVSGMLPKNRLRKERLGRLKTFENGSHPFKENLMKVGLGGGMSITEHPGVKIRLEEIRETKDATTS